MVNLISLQAMKKTTLYTMIILLLAACQHQLHFPGTPAVVVAHEKVISAIVVTDPGQMDYDSMVFRYNPEIIKEVHYGLQKKDSVIRTYFYDAAGRLSKLEDEKAIYYTNNDAAMRISFLYDGSGQLQQTKTDFAKIQGVTAYIINKAAGNNRQMIVYDTAYTTASYNLDWSNRIIYSTISNSNYILYDSAIFNNTSTPGLVKTIANDYSYAPDSSVNVVNRRIYFNHALSETGVQLSRSDKPAPVYLALRKKLYRNLSNWFEAGSVWQNDNYNLFPLPGGPYQSILYQGYTASSGSTAPYTRDYEFDNAFAGNQLNNSVVVYTLVGQGVNKYTTVLRFYYKD
jgi:hypothetical protein